nr:MULTISPECIES: metal-dependent transcriptional regulator [unclassified Actinomyces]
MSASNEEYLKTLWTLQEWSGSPTAPGDLAARTGVRPSTVSDALRRLQAAGLIERAPYGSVTLTEQGVAQALALVRRHRLLELFLVRTLGYAWDEVHAEADAIEHTVSALMVERIDAALGFPRLDPHGDPIPSADGAVEHLGLAPLADAGAGERLRVRRVDDRDAGLLRRLREAGVGLGTLVVVEPSSPFEDVAVVSVVSATDDDGGAEDGRRLTLSREDCERVLISPEPSRAP